MTLEDAWDRLLAKVRVFGPKGCWIVNNTPWYPRVTVAGERLYGHRVPIRAVPATRGIARVLADKYGVCKSTIHQIRRGSIWQEAQA